MYISESTEGFGRGTIVIIALNVFMICMMIAGFILDRKQKKADAKKKIEKGGVNYDEYEEAKNNNSASVSVEMKQIRKV